MGRKTLINKLDRVFSEYIRLRDADDNGYGRCISCGKVVHWKDADCGHYVNRKHMSLRYSEKNCNLQCRSCNRFDEGNVIGYTNGLIKKYGEDVLKELELAKKQILKVSDFELGVMINEYKRLIKNLKR